MLIACLTSRNRDALARDAERARARGADAVEVRADFLDDPSPEGAAAAVGGRSVYTLRTRDQGGRWEGTEARRVELLRRAFRAGFAFVDAEAGTAIDFEGLPARAILSFHDFEGIPADIERVAREMVSARPAFAKVVCRARDLGDELRLLGLQKALGSSAAVFGMGPSALASRVLGPRLGSPAVYAAPESGAESAPGQPALAALKSLYRADRVGPSTRVFGVAGRPLAHSRSPAFHNEAFARDGADAVYLPFEVEDFSLLWNARKVAGLSGLSVTIPHKEAALRAADEARPAAREAGCANTLALAGGKWIADNTDVPAARQALEAAAAGLKEARVLVLGAGGAARAVCLAVRQAGGSVVVAARDPGKGRALAAEFGGGHLRLAEADPAGFALVVNATPVGMFPREAEVPMDPSRLAPGQAVFDVVYNPEETAFLRGARERGCRTVGGLAMFLAQARRQQEIWKEARSGT
jgi:3-dehydroquinate dehydratase/shikimate dehydrogenase